MADIVTDNAWHGSMVGFLTANTYTLTFTDAPPGQALIFGVNADGGDRDVDVMEELDPVAAPGVYTAVCSYHTDSTVTQDSFNGIEVTIPPGGRMRFTSTVTAGNMAWWFKRTEGYPSTDAVRLP